MAVVATVELPAQPTSPSAARRWLSATLQRCRRPGYIDAGCLLVSELVTNAVLHARSPLAVRVDVTDARLRVEVADRHPAAVAPRRYAAEAATGRGLLLVEALAAAWGSEPEDDGKVVWFELVPGTENAFV